MPAFMAGAMVGALAYPLGQLIGWLLFRRHMRG